MNVSSPHILLRISAYKDSSDRLYPRLLHPHGLPRHHLTLASAHPPRPHAPLLSQHMPTGVAPSNQDPTQSMVKPCEARKHVQPQHQRLAGQAGGNAPRGAEDRTCLARRPGVDAGFVGYGVC